MPSSGHLKQAINVFMLQVIKLLLEGGGERMNYFYDFVTHCITGEDPSENDISEAKDLYEVPAVSQNWVLFSAHCRKLLPYPFKNYLFT